MLNPSPNGYTTKGGLAGNYSPPTDLAKIDTCIVILHVIHRHDVSLVYKNDPNLNDPVATSRICTLPGRSQEIKSNQVSYPGYYLDANDTPSTRKASCQISCGPAYTCGTRLPSKKHGPCNMVSPPKGNPYDKTSTTHHTAPLACYGVIS